MLKHLTFMNIEYNFYVVRTITTLHYHLITIIFLSYTTTYKPVINHVRTAYLSCHNWTDTSIHSDFYNLSGSYTISFHDCAMSNDTTYVKSLAIRWSQDTDNQGPCLMIP